MSSIWITGDTHGDFAKFQHFNFPIQKKMTRDDYIIVCGDFGIWHDNKSERYNFNELSNRKFTTLFVDGNHENYDRLCTEQYKKFMKGEPFEDADQGEFPIIPMFGGYVQQIRPHVFHLLRGEVYEILGKKIFAFGGAACHDVQDGILDRDNYKTDDDFYEDIYRYNKTGMQFRVARFSWWKEEIPNQDEINHALANLSKHNNKVDYIITHCAPVNICLKIGYQDKNPATEFLQQISETVQFDKWFFGHYHDDKDIDTRFSLFYDEMTKVHDTNP